MERREFLTLSAKWGALALLSASGVSCGNKEPGTVALPPLPYDADALAPYISGNTIGLHYGKHHQGYVNKLNKLITGTKYRKMPLEEIIRKTCGECDETAIFNNAAQVFNHTFYWNSMKPGGGGKPVGKIAEKVDAAFGSFEKFAEAFGAAAKSQFGSGWAWLVADGDDLKIMKTANADTPVAHDLKPLLTIDVWEHAYYPDYQNRRGDYIATYLTHLVNWEFAEKNLG
ncbi:superoxide dismutase [Desulfonema ishimotonii]|uniref:Superoxide dismutase n=1 Tax=Desulfonema ishimotonii TaxID=45657 RepID=A0A401G4I7_9BACT|nr:superoxide dismutase [Desulfonema ishimotonii]GBC64130.1 superoxide dismutase [Desulfonema ishimotonii]